MNKKHRKIMEDLASARPSMPPELEGWADSESAKRILREIIAKGMEPETPRRGRRPRLSVLVAFGVLALIVVGVAAFLAARSIDGSGEGQVVSQPTTTSSILPGEAPVTVGEALEQIIAAAKATLGLYPGQSNTEPGEIPVVVGEAVAYGMIPSVDAERVRLEQAVTRKQFVLWLWRVFSPVLPPGSVTATVSDIDALEAEEQRAVGNMVRDGVIVLGPDGAFEGEKLVTQADAAALLQKVRTLLQ